jgi:hypothetical protein
MKNLYFLLFILLIGCKDKEEAPPESKTAPLVVEFTGNHSVPIYSYVFITPHLQNSEYFYTDTAMSVAKTVNKPSYKGGQSVQFGATTRYASNGDLVGGGTYTLKVYYNSQKIVDKTITSGHTVAQTVDLPFIE